MKPRYGSATRPVVVIYHLIVDKKGDHQILSINDHAMTERFVNIEGYEEHLRSRHSFVERIGMGDVVMEGNVGTIGANGAALKERIAELRSMYPGAEMKMWMPDGESPLISSAPATMIEALASAIHKRVQPVIMTRATGDASPVVNGFIWIRITAAQIAQLLEHQPTNAIEAAGIYFIDLPPAMLDACVTVSVTRSAGALSLSLSCTNPSWRMTELGEPIDALHSLQLLWRQDGKDDLFVLAEKRGGEFRCEGWLGYEEAKKWALEGKAKDSGRSPDFKRSLPLEPSDEKD